MKKSWIKDNKHKIIVCLIILLAIIIRIINWPNGIYDINCDEAMLAINAKSISETGKDIYGTSLPVYFEAWFFAGQSALPTYLVALCVKLFGFSLFSIRLPILLISIASIYIIYLLSKKIFNEKVGIIVLFLTAINPWHILQSQWNLDCNMFPHVVLIAVYLLYTGITDKRRNLYFSMIFFALSMYCYGISIYFVPIFLLVMGIIFLIKKNIGIKEFLFCILIYLGISLPILLMYIVNFFDLDTINLLGLTIQKFKWSDRTKDMLIFSEDIFYQLKRNIKYLIYLILYQNDKLSWNSIKGFGTLYLQSMIFISVAITVLLSKKEKNKNHLIISVWLIFSIIIGLLINEVNINRLNIIWYPLIIYAGYGIYLLCDNLKYKKSIFSIIIGIYIISFGLFAFKFYNNYPEILYNSYTFSNGLIEAGKYINTIDTDEVIISENLNTQVQYVYLAYVFKESYELPIQKEYIALYNNKYISWIDSKDKVYEVEDLKQEKILYKKVYLIIKNEKKNIKNIDDYNEKEFNRYIVLEKK